MPSLEKIVLVQTLFAQNLMAVQVAPAHAVDRLTPSSFDRPDCADGGFGLAKDRERRHETGNPSRFR